MKGAEITLGGIIGAAAVAIIASLIQEYVKRQKRKEKLIEDHPSPEDEPV